MNEVERSFSVPGQEVSSRSFGCAWVAADALQEYWVDACQRFILTLDVLRQRGNNYLEQAARISPSVLSFAAETVMDGRTFERPVNYLLVRIKPPAGVIIDPRKRFEIEDMVRGDCLFAATGITDGAMLRGVKFGKEIIETETVVMRSVTGTVRRITAQHRQLEKFHLD